MRSVCILGSTGSIGTQTLEVIRRHPDQFCVVGLSCGKNIKLLKEQIREFDPSMVAVSDEKDIAELKAEFPFIEYFHGIEGITNLAKFTSADVILNALVGSIGIKPTYEAVKLRKTVALANKESLVTAGKLVTDLAYAKKVRILPIDSEHSNLYKQLKNVDTNEVNQIYITGSGGKYLNANKKEMSKVTYNQAIIHKNWTMGPKITIDSNTLMNKCFEVIEAYWYFKTKRINVLLDKTSLIHSAILMNNGAFTFSESLPLMTTPIAWALTDFNCPSIEKTVEMEHTTQVLELMNDIVPIKWAYEVINDKTNSLGIILNAADEVAIELFKNKLLRFDQIIDFIANAKNKIKPKMIKTYAQIVDFDKEVRLQAIKLWK